MLIINKNKLFNEFLGGIMAAAGAAIVQELRTLENPVETIKVKKEIKERKKNFEAIMKQTNLKEELA